MVGLAKTSSSAGLSASRADLFRTVSSAGAAALMGGGGTGVHYLVELWRNVGFFLSLFLACVLRHVFKSTSLIAESLHPPSNVWAFLQPRRPCAAS